jgi:asparagine synthase (glutamine-hydrolysing)
MCGIAGILLQAAVTDGTPTTPGGTRVRPEVCLNSMLRRLGHRGPDDEGTSQFEAPNYWLGLAHTRLAILDVSSAGHQPMHDPETGNWIVFNGEIYNFKEIRAALDLPSGSWRSQSDTETILKAYARWGADCLRRLRGMFAFAIWDAQAQQLFLARDHLGVKPLYYYHARGQFLFASEVRALLASELVPRQLDRTALIEYLTYLAVPVPRTIIKDVAALPPGSWLRVDTKGQIEQGEYWHLLASVGRGDGPADYAEARRGVHARLREAVELNLVSDVPVGVFLSGGIDSSALVALMREAGALPQTFTVVFSEEAYDEAKYARQIARRFATEHTEIRLTEATLLEQLPQGLLAMDQPTGDGINTYVISKAVHDAGLKVVLSGLGGDEFFAGYPTFDRLERGLKYARLWRQVPRSMRSLSATAIVALGRSSARTAKIAAALESDGSLPALYAIARQVLSHRRRQALLNGWGQPREDRGNTYEHLLRESEAANPAVETLTRISYAEARTYMHDVLLRDTDQMSMAHALEARVPLLDHKLVEYVMGLPAAYKRHNGTPKRLLVESLGGLLPEDIVRRPKQGFTLPFGVWMRGALRPFCEARLNSQHIRERGIFDPAEVSRLWGDFLRGAAGVSWSKVWVLVALEEWLENNQVAT